MQTKLTLRLDEGLIASAKAHAQAQGKSLSQFVADYFTLLQKPTASPATPKGTQVRALRGALRGASLDEADYREHLERKYLGEGTS